MAKGFEKCPCCAAGGRRNDGTLRLRHGGKDGFLIAMVCPRCYEKLIAQAQAIRNMAQVIVYGLSLNPDGGEMMIGKMNYKITRTETAYERSIIEQKEADKAIPNIDSKEEYPFIDEAAIEPDDSPFFSDEEDFDKWREEYKRGVR